MLTTMRTILIQFIRFTLILLATCTNETTPTQPTTPTKPQVRHICQQDKSRDHKDSLKGQTIAQLSSNSYSLSASRFDTAKVRSPSMTKLPVHGTRSRTGSLKKKNDTAADDLQKLVDREKSKMREDKKKKRADEKKAEEEKKKKTDQEKAAANIVTISPPSTNDNEALIDLEDDTLSLNLDEETADWTEADEEEALARFGISPNHLFGKEEEEETTTPNDTQTVDLTAAENSPVKKKTKSASVLPSSVKESNRYTTKSFSITKTVHKYDHPRTYVEAAITLTKEDKPKEFIAAIKSLLANGKILDPHFALAPLKRDTTTKTPKLITAEDDVPVNFTHLGQYAYTSGNRIFEKKKDWKGDKSSKKVGHRDNAAKEDIFHDPIVYFTLAIATDIQPRNLINGIRTEWEANGGGKLQVKDLQSQESKVVLALYYVFTGTPYSIILKTINSILRDATSIREHERMAQEDDEDYSPPEIPGISIRAQVPRLKGFDTSSLDKLPYHVKENRKVLHIETDPEDEAYLKELIQFAKERNVLALFLGKRARLSEVMDKNSTPGEIKRMVKCAMGHANYQGSMTGETIFGIDMIDGEVAPTAGSGMVSLRMVLFSYVKMEDKFYVFAELHQTEELGPVLAIIPACSEAEQLVHMMNKQVAAFLFYFLTTVAALPKKFVMDLLKATCDATLVAEIADCEWDPDTQTITTPQEKKENEDVEEMENATWWNNAFDLKDIGKKSDKRAADKKPEELFDLDADALSFATVHNRHLQPTFELDEEDGESEGTAPAANPSPATPPRKIPNKEATSTNEYPSVTASTPSEEAVVGDTCAADGG